MKIFLKNNFNADAMISKKGPKFLIFNLKKIKNLIWNLKLRSKSTTSKIPSIKKLALRWIQINDLSVHGNVLKWNNFLRTRLNYSLILMSN